MLKINDQEFDLLTHYMQKHYGINLSKKRVLVEGRLGPYINERGFNNYSDYLKEVFSDHSGKELSALLDRLTTNHTFFYRESAHFDFLRQIALPELEASVFSDDLRIWSAGCATGEEPYTLSMLLHEYFGYRKNVWKTSILATDISQRALERAKLGIYPAESIKHLPPDWQKKYFRSLDHTQVQVVDSVKKDVVFRNLNLMQEIFPFRSRFHIVFCRNVMIYFDRQAKRTLLKRLYDLTEKGGYLIIGHAESIVSEQTEFQYIRPSVYRRM